MKNLILKTIYAIAAISCIVLIILKKDYLFSWIFIPFNSIKGVESLVSLYFLFGLTSLAAIFAGILFHGASNYFTSVWGVLKNIFLIVIAVIFVFATICYLLSQKDLSFISYHEIIISVSGLYTIMVILILEIFL